MAYTRRPITRVGRFGDFTGGLNLRDDAFAVAANETPEILNLRIMPQGGVRQRKTMQQLFGSFSTTRNLFQFNGNGVAQIIVQDGNDAAYSTSGTAFTTINPDALTLTGLMRAGVMSRLTAANSDRIYVQRNAEQVAWKWDGSTSTVLADAHGAYNDNLTAPAGGKMPKAKYIVPHAGFMFHANTVEAGVSKPFRVRFSHPGEPEDYRTNDFFDVGVDDGDPITGLVPLGDTLIIFKSRSIWRLTGGSPTSFTLSRLMNNVGAVQQEAIAAAPTGIFFYDAARGVHVLTPDGHVTWLWQKLFPLIQLDTIPSAYTSTVCLGWMDNRLWVSVPTGASTVPIEHYVFDPACGNGAWYHYIYALFGTNGTTNITFGPMLEWRPTAGNVLYLQLANTVGLARLEVDESARDFQVGGVGGLMFPCALRTSWFTAEMPAVKKQFKRASFVIPAYLGSITISTFKDFQTATPRSSKLVTLSPQVGSGVMWGAANWGTFNWGSAGGNDAMVVRGNNIGTLYSLQFKLEVPATGQFMALDAIEIHYLVRRIT